MIYILTVVGDCKVEEQTVNSNITDLANKCLTPVCLALLVFKYSAYANKAGIYDLSDFSGERLRQDEWGTFITVIL